MVAASSLTPIFAGYVISLPLILPSSTLPGTRGQKLHLGNNLTNQLSGSPARTPTLELTQLLMLRLQPYGMSAKQQVPGSPGPHTFQLSPAKENQGEVFDTRPSSETVPPMPYLASWGLLSILILPNAEPKKQSPAQEGTTHTLRNLDYRNRPGHTCKTQERTATNVYQKHFETYTSNNQILVWN